jgi:hypothetical protein
MASGAGAASGASEPRSLSILFEAREGSALSDRGGSRASGVRRQAGIVRVKDRHRMAVTAPGLARARGGRSFGGRLEPDPGGAQRSRGHAQARLPRNMLYGKLGTTLVE